VIALVICSRIFTWRPTAQQEIKPVEPTFGGAIRPTERVDKLFVERSARSKSGNQYVRVSQGRIKRMSLGRDYATATVQFSIAGRPGVARASALDCSIHDRSSNTVGITVRR
jgi:hypothetical protein